MIREIVSIDESLCDGCGACVPNCHEGALQIVNGKARLVADRVCDGLGACLGHCPRGAIRIERREADAFDEAAVADHLAAKHAAPAHACPTAATAAHAGRGGCPGSRLMQFGARPQARPTGDAPAGNGAAQPSELTHWPVQLNLLPPHAPVLRGARLLVAADCVPIAYADFHPQLLRGRTVMIGCPKFDDLAGYVERLTETIRVNELQEIVVARMEVPCCGGIVAAVVEARRRAGTTTPVTEVIIGTRGNVVSQRMLPLEAAVGGRV